MEQGILIVDLSGEVAPNGMLQRKMRPLVLSYYFDESAPGMEQIVGF